MEEKYMFGRLLGEIYRLQKRVDPEVCKVSDATIYGFIEGIEYVVDEEMQIEVVSKNEVDIAGNILNQYWGDKEKLERFTGFYDIKHQLEQAGISRWKAAKIFAYFKANGQFRDLIEKMNSTNSPVECKTFELHELQNTFFKSHPSGVDGAISVRI